MKDLEQYLACEYMFNKLMLTSIISTGIGIISLKQFGRSLYWDSEVQ